jgi:hypothetical protein
VRITDGVLKLQLVPTTNASSGAYYSVHYTSDGKAQFSERWAVPPSTSKLRLRDIRIASTTSGSSGALTSVAIADVTGLSEELDLRPTKGAGWATSRVAMISSGGTLEAVSGTASDCVHVDGSSGACGSASTTPSTTTTLVDSESPAGTVDGANDRFTLLSAPSPAASLQLYRNGMFQKQGLDYAINGAVITFVSSAVPRPGDVLLASYRSATATGNLVTVPIEVICNSTGASTGETSLTTIGSCTIPASLLGTGDRVEIRFDFSHQGSDGAFVVEIDWGSTIVLSRTGDAAEPVFSGRVDAAITASGAQTSTQSWGGSSPIQTSAVLATDSLLAPLVVSFRTAVSAGSTDSVTLQSFTVLRYPSH